MTDEMGYEPPTSSEPPTVIVPPAPKAIVPPAPKVIVPPAADAVAAGWYPTVDGSQRYWDGANWTDHVTPGLPGAPAVQATASSASDDFTMGMLVHLLALFTGFIGPLVLWLIKKDDSAYVDYHGKEALNFQITMFIAFMAAFVLAFVLIGFLLLPVLFIINIIFPILGAVAANRGEYYRYPVSWRIIS